MEKGLLSGGCHLRLPRGAFGKAEPGAKGTDAAGRDRPTHRTGWQGHARGADELSLGEHRRTKG